MKKTVIVIVMILLTIFFGIFLLFGKIEQNLNQNSTPLNKSQFYTHYYNSNNIILINIWSYGSKTILHEKISTLNFLKRNNVKYCTFSISKDSIKLSKNIYNDSLLKKYDLTLKNFSAIDGIFSALNYRTNKIQLINFNFDITPYYIIIKNKKIYYNSNDFDESKIQQILHNITNDDK